MKRKIFGVIIIIIGLGLLVGFSYVMVFNRGLIDEWLNKLSFWKQEEVFSPPTTDHQNGSAPPSVSPPAPSPKDDARRIVVVKNERADEQAVREKFDKQDLLRMAGSFTERFGSFSNQSNYSNILDLKIFMSEKMKKWADNYIAEQRERGIKQDIYYGIITKHISKELKEFDEDLGQASVLVSTRRREATISTSNISNVFNQDIEINFIKERQVWRVDSAYWQIEY